MDRKQQLFEYCEKDTNLIPIIENIVYLEHELDKLRAQPKIKIHPNDATKQKVLPAAKLYKEYMQQYLNSIKIIFKIAGKDGEEEDSPLREYFKKLLEN